MPLHLYIISRQLIKRDVRPVSAEISDKAVAFILTMLDLHCDMDVDEHLPGMFILAAHHDARVRGFVQTHMLTGLPKLSSQEDLDGIPNFWSLLDTWVRFHRPPMPELFSQVSSSLPVSGVGGAPINLNLIEVAFLHLLHLLQYTWCSTWSRLPVLAATSLGSVASPLAAAWKPGYHIAVCCVHVYGLASRSVAHAS